MKHFTTCIILVALVTLCINQQEDVINPENREWTVQDWKEYLTLMSPPLGQDITSMVPAIQNIDELPVGTHLVYHIESFVVSTETDMRYTITISGKDTVKNIPCIVMDITVEAEITGIEKSMEIHATGTEWVDEEGTPVRIEEEMVMYFTEYEIPLEIVMERTGEEVYSGIDSWVFSGVQTMNVMGNDVEGTITEYIDKESSSVVRVITEVGDQYEDTGLIEPTVSTQLLEWELGGREGVTTLMGVYDCQAIYLKKNGDTVGTIWASEKVKVPIKAVFSYEVGGTNLDVVMTLEEYMLGT
ncbi:MAG: hypothetical protein HXS44_10875 [Theionarchaea archaeon]|nr:hypothetical protein [Theionarchaea archaeon]